MHERLKSSFIASSSTPKETMEDESTSKDVQVNTGGQ
jgi:hypothetical protein